MYSHEIDRIIKEYNSYIPSSIYIEISDIEKNPQIAHINYESYSGSFTIWTNDGWCWSFQVYRDKE